MRILFGDQRKLLKIMDGVLKSASKFAEEVEIETEEGSSWENETAESSEGDGDEVEAQPDDSSLREEPDSAKDVESEIDENRASATQGGRHIWGGRSDPDDSSFPLSMAMTSLEEISAMIERAEKAQSAVCLIFCRLIPIPHLACDHLLILAVDLDRGPEAEAQQRHGCSGVP